MRNVVFLFLIASFLLVASPAFAAKCEDLSSIKTWFETAPAKDKKQQKFFKNLKKCVETEGGAYRTQLDSTTITYVMAVADATAEDKSMQQMMLPFLINIIKINAEAGHASSQHNYAMFHNSNNAIADYVEQDYAEFMAWTRKAAAQGDVRAVFNLAMRLATEVELEGVKKDPELGYILLTVLNNIEDPNGVYDRYKEAWAKYHAQIGERFDEEKRKELEEKARTFEFSSLAE